MHLNLKSIQHKSTILFPSILPIIHPCIYFIHHIVKTLPWLFMHVVDHQIFPFWIGLYLYQCIIVWKFYLAYLPQPHQIVYFDVGLLSQHSQIRCFGVHILPLRIQTNNLTQSFDMQLGNSARNDSQHHPVFELNNSNTQRINQIQ